MSRPRRPLRRERVAAQVRVDYILAVNQALTLPGDLAPPHGAISRLVESLIGEWLAKKGATPDEHASPVDVG